MLDKRWGLIYECTCREFLFILIQLFLAQDFAARAPAKKAEESGIPNNDNCGISFHFGSGIGKLYYEFPRAVTFIHKLRAPALFTLFLFIEF